MKRLFIALALVFVAFQAHAGKISTGSTQPATCTIGDLWIKSNGTTDNRIYACTATNTYTLQNTKPWVIQSSAPANTGLLWFDDDQVAGALVRKVHNGTAWVAEESYTLPIATASVLGGVKQGSGVSIAGDGTLSVTASGIGLGTSDNPTFNSLHATGGNLAAANAQVTKKWVTGLTYTADITSVIHGQQHYICTSTHTAGGSTEPGVGASWETVWTVASGGTTDLSNYLSKTNTTAYTPTADYHPSTKKYVDDAITAGGGYTDEMAQDAVGGMFSGNTETGITITYDDTTAKINAVVATQFDGSQSTTGSAGSVGGMVTASGITGALNLTKTGTTARTVTFPDAAGTVALTSDISALSSVYQPLDSDLTTWAGVTSSANGRSLVSAADYTAMKTLLGLTIGTNIQAYDADLTTWAGITPGTGIGTWLATPSGANLASALTSALPATKGGTGLTALGTGVATAMGNTVDATGGFITYDADLVTAKGASSAGASKYFGTNSGSTVGFYDLPSGSTAAGSDTQVQFNDGGAFGGDSGLTYNKTTDSLSITGTVTAGAFASSAADGARYSEIPNTVALTSTPTLGRIAWLTDRYWLANGTNWTSRWLLDSSMIGVSGGAQAYDADLTTWAGVTPGTGISTWLATPSGANLASALTSALPATKGGTGLTALGTGVATALGNAVDASGGLMTYDADLADLADGSLTGTKVGFADTDNVWTATNVQAALEELNDSINAGVPNGTGAKVHWSQLTGVPAGFADGSDDGTGGGITHATSDGTYYASRNGAWSSFTSGNYTLVMTLVGNTAITLPTSGTLVTSDSTVTKTNLTLDVEGTGNSITVVDKVWFAAAGCNNATATSFYDLPTTNAPSSACITGTNTQKGVLDFDAATAESAQVSLSLPGDWTGAIDLKYKWLAAATSGNVVWAVQTSCVADSETDDPSWNTASTVTDAAKGTTLQTNDASITGITATGCAAGELLHLKFYRDAANGSDTMTGDARLIGTEVTLRRAQ